MIGKIDHVGIAVRSIEEARRFYEALGLEVAEIEDDDAPGLPGSAPMLRLQRVTVAPTPPRFRR
jgi:catechol 2,3-dioxygenase-like lactoylglutathione lyase family enzyme